MHRMWSALMFSNGMLFKMYINDLYSICKYENHILFADDTILFSGR